MSERARRILIVEDQGIVAADLENTLRKLGYEVVGIAATGEDAVREAGDRRAELVLMDIRLGGEMDGIEAAAIIGERFEVPVVYLTAYLDEETIARAKLTTPFGYVVKPFNEHELRAAIEIALYKHETDRMLADERARRRVAEEWRPLIENYENALRESEQQFRTAVMRAPVPMMLHAEDGEVLAVSDAVVEATGYSRDRIRTLEDWLELAYGERAAEVRSFVERALENGHPPPHELGVRIASGEIRQWLFHVSEPLPLGEGRRGFVAVAVDVTSQRRAEQELHEAQRQKDEFIAMLGHELRNPLAAIRSAAELLKMTANGDPTYQRTQAVLERQTGHMARLIDGLLDVSQLIGGHIDLDQDVVDLRSILQETIQDRLVQLENRGLELRTDVDEDPLWVCGDRARLAQVFDHLLSNAIRFTEPPGSVTVSARREGDRAVVEVRDTGTGIDPNLLPFIFEPFRQAEQSLARAAGGLGLGLSIVKGVVELHGGTVFAANDPIEGAELTVRFPLAPAPRERPAQTHELGGPARVLIVEDNADAADTLRLVLETLGNEVDVAYDAESALTEARRFRPEVILCDIGLPGELNGYDLARALRDDGSHALLVAVTGYGRPEDIQRADEVGFDAHLTKPIDAAAIQTILAEHRNAHDYDRAGF